MKKIVLIFGSIAGLIVVAMLFITIPLYNNGTLQPEMGELVGYTTMVVAMSMIFFGVKSYRDNHLSGKISFVNALKVGLLIAGVASAFYVVGWEIDFNLFQRDFMEKYASGIMKKESAAGASPEHLAAVAKKMKEMQEIYQVAVFRMGMTLAEILPVGILMAVIAAGFLRKK